MKAEEIAALFKVIGSLLIIAAIIYFFIKLF